MHQISTLTPKEKKILIALSYGSRNKEIASDYGISVNTVKKHLKNIYRKLEVTRRSQAVERLIRAAPKLGEPTGKL